MGKSMVVLWCFLILSHAFMKWRDNNKCANKAKYIHKAIFDFGLTMVHAHLNVYIHFHLVALMPLQDALNRICIRWNRVPSKQSPYGWILNSFLSCHFTWYGVRVFTATTVRPLELVNTKFFLGSFFRWKINKCDWKFELEIIAKNLKLHFLCALCVYSGHSIFPSSFVCLLKDVAPS